MVSYFFLTKLCLCITLDEKLCRSVHISTTSDECTVLSHCPMTLRPRQAYSSCRSLRTFSFQRGGAQGLTRLQHNDSFEENVFGMK